MRCLTLSAIPPHHLRFAVGVGLLAVEVEQCPDWTRSQSKGNLKPSKSNRECKTIPIV